MGETEELEGYWEIDSESKEPLTVFRDEQNGYTISKFNRVDEFGFTKRVTIKGYFDSIPVGFLKLYCTKDEKDSEKYGVSYVVNKYECKVPTTQKTIILYLVNYLSLTLNQAEKVYEEFKEDVFKELDEDVNKLDSIKPKLFKKKEREQEVKKLWSINKYSREIRLFFYSYELTESNVQNIEKAWNLMSEYQKLNGDSVSKLISDVKKCPYILLKAKGVGFEIADKVGQLLGISKYDLTRILIGITYTIETHCYKTSEIAVEEQDLYRQLLKLLQIDISFEQFRDYCKKITVGSYDEQLDKSLFSSIRIFLYTEDKLEQYIVYLDYMFRWESEIISFFSSYKTYKKEVIEISEEDLKPEVLSNGKTIKLNKEQKQAIENVFEYKCSIITGQGGTGKSTILKRVVDKCKREKRTYVLLAPTGKAVDVLVDVTQESDSCSTIHRRIGLKQEGSPPEVEIDEEVIILDESSMVATPLLYSLVLALKEKLKHGKRARFVLVGDDNQLKPVGVGNPFKSLIQSKILPTTKLIEIYRQKDGLLLDNCRRVIEESKPSLVLTEETESWEMIDIGTCSSSQAVEVVLNKVKHTKFNPETDVVLTARKASELGVYKLNEVIQKYLNRSNSDKFEEKKFVYYLGDRVMYTDDNWYREDFLLGSGQDVDLFGPDILQFKDSFSNLDLITSYFNSKKKTLEDSVSIYGELKEDSFELYEEPIEKKKIISRDLNVYNGNWGFVIGYRNFLGGWTGKTTSGKRVNWSDDDWVNLYSDLKEERKTSFKKLLKKFVLLVQIGEKVVPFTLKQLINLEIFYAGTVHKAQGSQFKNVYAICAKQDIFMLDCYWLYTLLSRTQDKCYYFSDHKTTRTVQLRSNLEGRKSILTQGLITTYKKKQEQLAKVEVEVEVEVKS